MLKTINRDAYSEIATTSMVEDNETRVKDLLVLFSMVAEDDLFKHEIRTWDHKEATGQYL